MTELMKVTPSQIEGILGQIRSASSLTDLTEARARIEAARAWAKVHGEVKAMRLDLLRVEVEALVRIVELGGIDTLPARDRKAARYLANLTQGERAELVANSGAVTTAAGMVKAVWNEQELLERRRENRDIGKRLAELPDLADDEEVKRFARANTYSVQFALSDLLEEFTEAGEPFTVGELADSVIHRASVGEFAHDPDVEQGIQHVVREAIRRQPVVKIDDTVLPRLITALSDSGGHIRIPVENALLGHLDQMIEMRREQLRQDQVALNELVSVAARLRKIPGADDESRIGDLLVASITSPVQVAS